MKITQNKKDKVMLAEAIVETEKINAVTQFPRQFKTSLLSLLTKKEAVIGGGALVIASFVANVLNYLFNAFLGRILTFQDFALIGLIGGFLSFASIFFGAYATSLNYKSGFLIGKYGDGAAHLFWKNMVKQVLYPSVIIAGIWLLLTPLLMQFFHTDNIYLFLLFGVVLLVGFISNINQGYLASKMMFGSLAILSLTDPIIKLTAVFILAFIGLQVWSFAAIPLSAILVFIVTWIIIRKQVQVKIDKRTALLPLSEVHTFSKKFLIISLLMGVTSVAYFTFDILLAKHFLSATDAGKYALVSLVGKMIFFLGNITSPFVIPLISRYEGAQKNSQHALYTLLGFTSMLTFVGFILFGVFGYLTVPFLYGQKALSIVPYLVYFTFGMACYTVSSVLVNYYLIRKNYIFPIATFFLVFLQIFLLMIFHDSVKTIVLVMTVVLVANLVVSVFMHIKAKQVKKFEKYISKLKKLSSMKSKHIISAYTATLSLQKLITKGRNNNG